MRGSPSTGGNVRAKRKRSEIGPFPPPREEVSPIKRFKARCKYPRCAFPRIHPTKKEKEEEAVNGGDPPSLIRNTCWGSAQHLRSNEGGYARWGLVRCWPCKMETVFGTTPEEEEEGPTWRPDAGDVHALSTFVSPLPSLPELRQVLCRRGPTFSLSFFFLPSQRFYDRKVTGRKIDFLPLPRLRQNSTQITFTIS